MELNFLQLFEKIEHILLKNPLMHQHTTACLTQ